MAQTKKSNEDKPWIENYPELDEWLKTTAARGMWEKTIGEGMGQQMIRYYLFPNGKAAIVTVWAQQGGYQIWTESAEVKTPEYFTDTEKRLGL